LTPGGPGPTPGPPKREPKQTIPCPRAIPVYITDLTTVEKARV